MKTGKSKRDLFDFEIDFDENKADYKRQALRGGQELIVKAVTGGKKNLHILDLSAGLAIDAVFLVQQGFKVTAVERNPQVYSLLQSALKKTQRQDLQDLEFVHDDSLHFLSALPSSHHYDVAYFDPMYPEKKKSALPRKEMVIFRQMVGDDEDAEEVAALALSKGFSRLVIKRPLRAPFLLPGVRHSFEGHSVRYDLYQMVGKKMGI